jgi:hypothetical protein
MQFYEFKPIKPTTQQQARINSLKRSAEIAKQAVDSERKASRYKKLKPRSKN